MASDNSPDNLSNCVFGRSEIHSSKLSDNVDPDNRHVLLFRKSDDASPSRVEDSDHPKLLNSSMEARKDEFPLQISNPQETPYYVRFLLDYDKLNYKNFCDWHLNLRIALRLARKEYVLERAISAQLPEDASHAERVAHNRHIDDDREVSSLMLACMERSLQVQFENFTAYDMIMSLKSLFARLARTERFNTLCSLMSCRLSKGSPVSPHVIKMIGYLDKLERLGTPFPKELQTDIILHSLSDDYDSFICNFLLFEFTKTNHELHEMLKVVESNLKKERANLLMVQKGKGFKKSKKGKDKKRKAQLMKSGLSGSKPKAKAHTEDKCHYCSERGHWKRNCKRYLIDLKQGRVPFSGAAW